MNLQDIRKYYEYPVIDCCNLQGVEFRAENTLEPGGDAIHISSAWRGCSSAI